LHYFIQILLQKYIKKINFNKIISGGF